VKAFRLSARARYRWASLTDQEYRRAANGARLRDLSAKRREIDEIVGLSARIDVRSLGVLAAAFGETREGVTWWVIRLAESRTSAELRQIDRAAGKLLDLLFAQPTRE
jgi:hypothetical protein